MAVDFKNSETKDNLMRAFAGESQARNRYTFAAGQAKKENLQVIAAVFMYPSGFFSRGELKSPEETGQNQFCRT